MKQPRLNSRQARWLIALTPYDFTIHHRPGNLNPADGSLRRPDYIRETVMDLDIVYLLLTLTFKFAKVHSIGHDKLRVPMLPKGQESCRVGRKTHVEELRSFSIPTLVKEPESSRRRRKTRVEETQSQIRADMRTIEQTAKTVVRRAMTPDLFPDCVSEGEETDHLLRVLSIQAVTRKEARTACRGEYEDKNEPAKPEPTTSQELIGLI